MTKFLSALFVFVSLLFATACQKPTDTGRVQEEALAIVKVHAATIDQLQRRADSALARGRTLGSSAQGIADAGRRLTEARAQLDQLKGLTSSAPTVIAAAAKTGEVDEMSKVIDSLTEKLQDGSAAARADITAVESWLATVEGTRAAPASPPVTMPHTGTPEGVTGTGSGSPTGGANAPADVTTPTGDVPKPAPAGDAKPAPTGTAPTGTAPAKPAPTKPAATGTAPAKATSPTKPGPTPAASKSPNAGGSPTGGANPTPK